MQVGGPLALVEAVIASGAERQLRTCRLLGRMTRLRGQPVAAEVEVLERTATGWRPTPRVTLVEAKDVTALNDAARELMRPVPTAVPPA